ncbi:MAG: acetylxylan esterase [Verrucomicrobia bacterium]|nr:acetylxylan esterase [Verrucomicrobiota bacterium]
MLFCSTALLSAAPVHAAERRDVNYDEAKVNMAPLPDPLVLNSGKPVTSSRAWTKQRRPEVLELFQANVYGRSPGKPKGMKFEITGLDHLALDGLATRKEITVWFTGKKDGPKMTILLYVPNGAKKPVPAFLGLNFYGNHTVDSDPGITLSTAWMRDNKDAGVVNGRATDKSRGFQTSRWQIEKVVRRGYATATIYYGDLEPDHADGWKTGLRAALSKDGANTLWKPDDWGAIGAWAWGLSRALDYLETDKDINAKQVAVHGHSRLGKTSLWAGASDERFAIVISNDSGEGGAALTRRDFGETTAIITKAFPHWFCPRYATYASNAPTLPVDQHELIALMAPRPVYIASATEDQWADPRGEFLSGKNAEPVYALFKKAGLGVADQPAADHPVGNFIGYHLRTGKHDITEFDWEQYLNFADRHFGKAKK